jgi:hypothetical protein
MDPNSTTTSIEAPFLRIELERSMCGQLFPFHGTNCPIDVLLGGAPHAAVSASVTASQVSNFTLSDIVCILYDRVLSPITKATDKTTTISSNTTKAIYATGCGTPGGLPGDQNSQRRTVGPSSLCTLL